MTRCLFFFLLVFSVFSFAEIFPVRIIERNQENEKSYIVSFARENNEPIPINVGDYVKVSASRLKVKYTPRMYSVTDIKWIDKIAGLAESIEITITVSDGHFHLSKRLSQNNKNHGYQLEVISTGIHEKLVQADTIVLFALGEASTRPTGIIRQMEKHQTFCLVHSVREGKNILHEQFLRNLPFYRCYKTGGGAPRITESLPDITNPISMIVEEFGTGALYILSGSDRTLDKESEFENTAAQQLKDLGVRDENIIVSSWN